MRFETLLECLLDDGVDFRPIPDILTEGRRKSALIPLLESIYPLTEAVEISNAIKAALDRRGMSIPDDDMIKSLEIVDDGYVNVKTDRRTETRKLGALLKSLFPNLHDNDLRKLVDDIKAEHEISKRKDKIEFKLVDDVRHFYGTKCKDDLESCQTGTQFKPELADFYSTQAPNLKLLALYINGKLSGRALLWSHVKNAKGGMFLDRSYPPTDMEVRNHYTKYAVANGWTYRRSNDIIHPRDVADTVDGSGELEYQCLNVERIKYVPYMDTFRYGDFNGSFYNDGAGSADMAFSDVQGINFKTGEPSGRSFDKNVPELSELFEAEMPLAAILEYYSFSDIDFFDLFQYASTRYANSMMQDVSNMRRSLSDDVYISYLGNVGINQDSLLKVYDNADEIFETFNSILEHFNDQNDRLDILKFMYDVISEEPDERYVNELLDNPEHVDEPIQLCDFINQHHIALTAKQQKDLIYDVFIRVVENKISHVNISKEKMKARTFEKLPNSLTFMYGFIKGSNPTTPLYKDTKDLLLDMLDGLTKEVRELGYSADADYVAEFNKFLEDNSIIQK